MPPFEMVIEPELFPCAPAFVSPVPAIDPTSPAEGPDSGQLIHEHITLQLNSPSPGCCGVEDARAAYNEKRHWQTFLESKRRMMLLKLVLKLWYFVP